MLLCGGQTGDGKPHGLQQRNDVRGSAGTAARSTKHVPICQPLTPVRLLRRHPCIFDIHPVALPL